MSDKNIQMLFERAMSWETKARDFYINLANLFRHEPRVSEFWLQLSEDEAGHIELLKETLDLIPMKERFVDVDDKQWNVVLQVDEFLKEASNTKILTLDDAYELAHQIENSEVNAVFRLLAIDSAPEKQMQQFILTQLTEHVDRLSKFGKQFTQDNRKSISVQMA